MNNAHKADTEHAREKQARGWNMQYHWQKFKIMLGRSSCVGGPGIITMTSMETVRRHADSVEKSDPICVCHEVEEMGWGKGKS